MVSAFMTMRVAPVGRSGWTKDALDLATGLGVHPPEIWPEHLQNVRLQTATASLHLDAHEVTQIAAHDLIDPAEAKDLLEKMLSYLSPRYEGFMRWRLADGANATFSECGDFLGVNVERARQIERSAMSKMRQGALYHGVRSLS